ncbi:MAG TPA: recombinase family protein [Burkholderiales bacterium]|nr:recombinase family protein [Burkholderiales bacterium]
MQPDGAVVGYIRVSSAGQDYAYQRTAIEAAARARGERVHEWFGDVASGSTLERPELGRLRAALDVRRVRTVWVWRLDRLTRSGIADTLASVEHVRRSGAELVSVADRVALDGGPTGELVLAVLAWCAQMELAKIHENQDAARARMRQQGRTWGRPALPSPLKDAVAAAKSQGMSCREIARQLKVSKSWVAGVLKELGL